MTIEKDNIIGKDTKIVNIGILNFYNALAVQDVDVVQVNWKPPPERDKEIDSILNKIL